MDPCICFFETFSPIDHRSLTLWAHNPHPSLNRQMDTEIRAATAEPASPAVEIKGTGKEDESGMSQAMINGYAKMYFINSR